MERVPLGVKYRGKEERLHYRWEIIDGEMRVIDGIKREEEEGDDPCSSDLVSSIYSTKGHLMGHSVGKGILLWKTCSKKS